MNKKPSTKTSTDQVLVNHLENLMEDIRKMGSTVDQILGVLQDGYTVTSLSKNDLRTQNAILVRGSGYDAYIFARDVEGADMEALQQVVLERGNGCDAYQFAVGIPGADIPALQRVVLDRCDSLYAYHFAKSVIGADVPALQGVVLEHGDGKDAYYFALDVKTADLAALHERLVELNTHGEDSGYLDQFNRCQSIRKRLKRTESENDSGTHSRVSYRPR